MEIHFRQAGGNLNFKEMNNNTIRIIEKPAFVSWEEIHEVLWKAHSQNRERGINMVFSTFSGDKIRDIIEKNTGKMFIALDNNIVVGTGAIIKKKISLWCGKDDYGYLCFASVLPNYNGMGIYKSLSECIERETRMMGADKVLFETHEHNERMLRNNRQKGYKCVDFKVTTTDHYNVLMVKWLDGCPYPNWYIKLQFLTRKWYRIVKYKPGKVKRFGLL